MPTNPSSNPNTSSIPRIFVSHSHEDTAFCREFVSGLRAHHLDVWYDEHNLGWGMLHEEISRELDARNCFIVILSPAAIASRWVNREIGAALDLESEGHITSFIVVLAQPCSVPALLRGYRRIQPLIDETLTAKEAAERAHLAIIPEDRSGSSVAPAPSSVAATPIPPSPLISPDRFPARLTTLGFIPRRVRDPKTGKVIEFIVPPLCEIPAGSFQMGIANEADSDARDYDGPPRSVTLPAFHIARYPVTVAEYACFVRSGHAAPPQGYLGVDWPTQLTRLDHPVTCVTWHDATAYAAWLATCSGDPWRLPSEEEWEKAARWEPRSGKSRIYPWGDAFDVTRCNTAESGVNTTIPIGNYPDGSARSGASPCGAEDMAGNVWEWTRSVFDNTYIYPKQDYVLRGGGWGDTQPSARAAYRNKGGRDLLIDYIGFRLVCATSSS